MSPDLPLFVPFAPPYVDTHQLWAAASIDLVTGALLLTAWSVLLRPALVAIAPRGIRARLPSGAERSSLPRASMLLVASILLGSVTHVCWDTFTHPGRLGTRLLPVLDDRFGPLAIASWLQYVSSVAGLVLLLVWAARSLVHRPSRQDAVSRLGPASRPALVLAVGIAVIAVAVIAATAGGASPGVVVVDVLTRTVDVVVVLLAVIGTALAVRSAAGGGDRAA